MTIHCVTFDLDDTLWDIAPVVDSAESHFYAWLRASYPEVSRRFEIDTLTDHRRKFYSRYPDMLHDFTWLRRKWLEHIASEYGYAESFVELGFEVYYEHRNTVDLFPGAHATLENVSSRYKTGVITNGNACVDRIGIARHFQFVISAASAGVSKPDARIFQAAVQASGVAPDQIAHVGDDPERDIKGASRFGMKTIWYNPAGTRWPGGVEPDATIGALPDLVGVLEALAGS